MNNVVEVDFGIKVVSGRIVVSSLAVARVFGKEHKHVLRAIRVLVSTGRFSEPNFVPNKIKVLNNPSGEETASYDMDEIGCNILVMGFTGEKALKYQIAYATEFQRMREELLSRPTVMPSTVDGAYLIMIGQQMQKVETERTLALAEVKHLVDTTYISQAETDALNGLIKSKIDGTLFGSRAYASIRGAIKRNYVTTDNNNRKYYHVMRKDFAEVMEFVRTFTFEPHCYKKKVGKV